MSATLMPNPSPQPLRFAEALDASGMFEQLLMPDLHRVLTALNGQPAVSFEACSPDQQRELRTWARRLLSLVDEGTREAALELAAHRVARSMVNLLRGFKAGDENAVDVIADESVLEAWVKAQVRQGFGRGVALCDRLGPAPAGSVAQA